MAGIGGRPGWAWIFILEGLLTVLFGVLSFWAVHDFPDEATFLTEQDRARVIRRLKMDQQSSAEHEKFKMAYFYAALRDYKMWIGMAIYMGCDMPLYGFSLFLPTIIKDMSGTPGGYPTVTAQLLTVPPYAVAACFTIFIGWLADRTHQRGLCNMGVSIIGMVGFAMLIASDGPKIRYAATFLGALGIYPCIANTISWVSNNVEGVYKRGIILGFVIGWGNLNGIVSSNIFPSKDASRYIPGNSVILSYMVVFLFGGSLAMYLLLRRENNLRLNGKRDFWVEGMTREEAEKLGDRRPDFIYTL
jgi:MFS family permease